MKLQQLLSANKIVIHNQTQTLALKGLNIMKKATDKSHGLNHVYHIFENLNYLLKKNSHLKDKINFNVLILAICWHDVWICKQKPKNIFHLIYLQMVEGLKSSKMFYLQAKKSKLDWMTLNLTRYVIRKHSSFQLLPSFMLEAKILFDLDKIEMWNYRRFFKLGTALVSQKQFYQKYIVRFYYYYSEKMGVYIKDLEKKFKKSSEKFWKGVFE